MSVRLLLIEDNANLAFGLRRSLEVEGYEVAVAGRGGDGLGLARRDPPDLLILDLMLPDRSGYDVLRTLRDEGLAMPVLILTARGEEVDKVQGFRLGADDYVVKPVGVLELLARVEAILRRTDGGRTVSPTIRIADITIDLGRRTVSLEGEPLDLAPLEFDLLASLARRGGRIATRRDLLREVWGYQAAVESRTVDTHIAKIRAKLQGSSARIVTVRKKGYRLEAP
jgi:DNA-binding response OmpR family regulator